MNDRLFTANKEHELQPDISREQVVDAFKALSGNGDLDPADLDPDDPEISAANKLFDKWLKQQEAQLHDNTVEEQLRFEARTTTLFVEAGFRDPDYLDEVANDWLVETLVKAETANLTQLVSEIENKITEINETATAKWD